jgi:hypothetical protein
MKRSRRYRWIAILSTVTAVGGIAISANAYVQIHESSVEQGKLLLPAANKQWSQAPSNLATAHTVAPGGFIGTINIPSIKKQINIFQGTGSIELKKGVGHYLQSVMPGLSDNSVLAGHRDTVFSNLGKVKIGAFVVIATQDGTFIYKVNRIRIVNKNDRTVIVPTAGATLTLSTCYPFRFIGSAPQRYVVSAYLVPDDNASAGMSREDERRAN